MKEIPKILELLSALQEERLPAGWRPMPGPCAPGENYASAYNEVKPAIHHHYYALLLWAAGHYAGKVAPLQAQQMLNAFLLNCCRRAFFGRPFNEPPAFEALQQGLQAYIDGWLDSNTEK